MFRVLPVLLAFVMVSAVGCALPDFVRRHHESELLRYPDPEPSTVHWENYDRIEITPPSATPYEDRQASLDFDFTLDDAVAAALSHSGIVRVSQGGSVEASSDTAHDVAAEHERVREALAAFDASFESSFVGSKKKRPPNSFFGPGLTELLRRDEAAFNVGLTKPLRTGGGASLRYNPNPGYFFIPQPDPDVFNPRHVGRLEIGIEQPLMRNAGVGFNTIPIKISQISIDQSAWKFKQSAMESVRSVCVAYWDLYAAQAALKSVEEVIPLLEEIVRLQQAALTTEWVIEADVAKAYGQLHRFQEERLDRQSDIAEVELRLRNLVGAPSADGRNLVPASQPFTDSIRFDSTALLNEAMTNHPDIVRQRLDVRLRKLELVQAENALLPQMDFVALYRMNGLGDNLGDAIEQMATAEVADWELGAL
ncbi:MAG: TolC family protein, partial [Planctomycetales bacterium]|nr:TolC family protein [Planctomycetales bacterium]